MGYLCSLPLIIVTFSTLVYTLNPLLVEGVPLSTKSRWIVNEKGERVKLVCVNWVSHLTPVVVEGLSKQPVNNISNMIKSMGFNCVRLTYPIYLATNTSLAYLTVTQSFTKLGLFDALAGLRANNPDFVNLTLIDAFQEVVKSLGENDIMVILDNHVSKPGWCCSNSDGNGFFGDQYFDPDNWINGLLKMATLFKDNSNVVAMSLRNELRGPKQNTDDWYRYMQRGAEAVHSANPNVLVILSGLSFDTNLSFLNQQQVNLSFTNKLVFEVHWYTFTNGKLWNKNNANQVCGSVVNSMMGKAGFLLDQEFPLFLSEFGFHLVDTNQTDHRYIDCVLAWLADHDIDWAFWALQGSYYLRQGKIDMNETYALLDSSWSEPNNSSFIQKLSLVQTPLRGPGVGGDDAGHEIIFHPKTGLCVQRNRTQGRSKRALESLMVSLKLGSCKEADNWTYTPEMTLTLKGTSTGLEAQGLDRLARISQVTSGPRMRWEPISDSKLHLSARLDDNTRVCLDVDSNNYIITTNCNCLSGDATCDPLNQWFKIVLASG